MPNLLVKSLALKAKNEEYVWGCELDIYNMHKVYKFKAFNFNY